MSSSYEPLIPATLAINADGTPVSPLFDDIYYAGTNPLAQAREVFLAGNQLPLRWQGRTSFTVLETGFGLGHNFLALWRAWRDDPRRCARLHMVSIEAHPFSRDDLAILLSRLEGTERMLGRCLLKAWPVLTPGIHRLEFEDGAVTLTLAFGSIERMVPQLDAGFDACFLDGFSPRVNPDMWSLRVFRQLVRMANRDATMATWCSAGHVRRDLQAVGFRVQRHAGFGTKRHRITGQLRAGLGQPGSTPGACQVAVVGAGFAGAATAYALAARGHAVSVFDPALAVGRSGTHEGHSGAAMTPSLNRDDDIRSRLSRAGVLLARLRWGNMGEDCLQQCGAFEPVASGDQAGWQRTLERLRFPRDYVRWVDEEEAAALTGMPLGRPGLWHGYGHVVRPEPLLDTLLRARGIRLHCDPVERLASDGAGRWRLYGASAKLLAHADWVVVANSWLAARLLKSVPGLTLPSRLHSLKRIAGQLSYFSVEEKVRLKSLLTGGGLCLPDGERGLIGGSTYVRDTTLSIMTGQGHHENREKVMTLLGDRSLQLAWPRSLADGWSGWRAAVRDRLPVIGPVATAPGLWLACGFGSRGLTWSALSAELLAARLDHEPIPLERGLLKKLAPI